MPTVNDLVDESALSIGIYAECLCRCSLQMSKEGNMSSKDFDRLNRLFENGLKSTSLAVKISTLHGLLYWLEAITLGYIGTNEAKQLTDHLCKQINQVNDFSVYLTANARFISTLWSAVFYAIENCLDSIKDAQTFVATFIRQTYAILNDPNTPYFLFNQLYMGLERFLLSSMVPSFELNSIQKLATAKFYDEQRALCLISLTVTSLYASNQSKQINYWNDIVANKQQSSSSSHATTSSSLGGLLSASNSLNNIAGLSGETMQTNTNMAANNGYPQILELNAYPDLQTHLLKVHI